MTVRMAPETEENRAAFEPVVGPFTDMMRGMFAAVEPYVNERILSP